MDLKKEIEELKLVFKEAEVLDEKALEVFELAEAYLSDSEYFLKKGMEKEALEAYSISWAYIDALLHLKLIKIPKKFEKKFTVEIC